MDKKLMMALMENLMPAFPKEAPETEKRFSAVQLQAFAFEAMEALLKRLPDASGTVEQTAVEVREILRDLSYIEAHLERTKAPLPLRTRTIDIRAGIHGLSAALARSAEFTN